MFDIESDTEDDINRLSESETTKKYPRLAKVYSQNAFDTPQKYRRNSRPRIESGEESDRHSTSEEESFLGSYQETKTPQKYRNSVSSRKSIESRKRYDRRRHRSPGSHSSDDAVTDLMMNQAPGSLSIPAFPDNSDADTREGINHSDDEGPLNNGNESNHSSSSGSDVSNNSRRSPIISSGSESCKSWGESDSDEANISSCSSLSEDDEELELDVFEEFIYSGSTVSIGASCTLILQFCRKYKLSRKAQNDLLTLIKLHLPDEAEQRLPKSHGQLVKKVMPLLQKVHKLNVCTSCNKAFPPKSTQCQNGHVQEQSNDKKKCYFYVIPLEPQLRMLLEDYAPVVIERCRNQVQILDCHQDAAVLKDVTDGTLYRKVLEDGDSDAYHVTIMLSTDGAPVFKSQNFSIWPLYASVLELPIHRRFSAKNILLLGMWYGQSKPVTNTFLEQTLTEINIIKEHKGIIVTDNNGADVKFVAHVHSLVCDLPAKSMALLHKLYNGKFGCMTCYHPGKKLPLAGNVRVYPFTINLYKMRTVDEMRSHAELAEQFGTDVYGVKGFSILHNYLRIPDGCPIDYMHCVLQGTAKWIIKAMLDSKNKDSQFYIKPYQQRALNEKLERISVPHDMDRKPRSLYDIKHWKASEIQHFLLYFGLPLLKPYVHHEFFHHLALLSTGLWILLKRKITSEELSLAGNMLKSFGGLMKSFYGDKSETINAHNITHLAEQVKSMGPLWTHSAFSFEAMIAHTLKGFKGTRGVPEQIVDNYIIDKQIHPLNKKLQQSQASQAFKAFSTNLSLSKPRSNWIQLSESISFSAPLNKRHLTAPEVDAINELCTTTGLEYVNTHTVGSYAQRMYQGGEVYHSKSYKRAGKSNSYLIQFFKENDTSVVDYFFGEIQEFVHIGILSVALVKYFPPVMTTICKNSIDVPSDTTVREFATSGLLASHHISIVSLLETELLAVSCDNITAKCILVEANEPFVSAYLTPIIDIHCT